jgi:hypothetical protein
MTAKAEPVTGTLSLQTEGRCYTLFFVNHGWIAADMVQYIGEVLQAPQREVAILKLLGYTMEVGSQPPARAADHWVEVDLDRRILRTNSDFIRKSVQKTAPAEDDPYVSLALRNVYAVLDSHDFTVELAG